MHDDGERKLLNETVTPKIPTRKLANLRPKQLTYQKSNNNTPKPTKNRKPLVYKFKVQHTISVPPEIIELVKTSTLPNPADIKSELLLQTGLNSKCGSLLPLADLPEALHITQTEIQKMCSLQAQQIAIRGKKRKSGFGPDYVVDEFLGHELLEEQKQIFGYRDHFPNRKSDDDQSKPKPDDGKITFIEGDEFSSVKLIRIGDQTIRLSDLSIPIRRLTPGEIQVFQSPPAKKVNWKSAFYQRLSELQKSHLNRSGVPVPLKF